MPEKPTGRVIHARSMRIPRQSMNRRRVWSHFAFLIGTLSNPIEKQNGLFVASPEPFWGVTETSDAGSYSHPRPSSPSRIHPTCKRCALNNRLENQDARDLNPILSILSDRLKKKTKRSRA